MQRLRSCREVDEACGLGRRQGRANLPPCAQRAYLFESRSNASLTSSHTTPLRSFLSPPQQESSPADLRRLIVQQRELDALKSEVDELKGEVADLRSAPLSGPLSMALSESDGPRNVATAVSSVPYCLELIRELARRISELTSLPFAARRGLGRGLEDKKAIVATLAVTLVYLSNCRNDDGIEYVHAAQMSLPKHFRPAPNTGGADDEEGGGSSVDAMDYPDSGGEFDTELQRGAPLDVLALLTDLFELPTFGGRQMLLELAQTKCGSGAVADAIINERWMRAYDARVRFLTLAKSVGKIGDDVWSSFSSAWEEMVDELGITGDQRLLLSGAIIRARKTVLMRGYKAVLSYRNLHAKCVVVVAELEYILREEFKMPARRALHIAFLEKRSSVALPWWVKIGIDNAHMTTTKGGTTLTSMWVAFFSSWAQARSVRALHTIGIANAKDTSEIIFVAFKDVFHLLELLAHNGLAGTELPSHLLNADGSLSMDYIVSADLTGLANIFDRPNCASEEPVWTNDATKAEQQTAVWVDVGGGIVVPVIAAALPNLITRQDQLDHRPASKPTPSSGIEHFTWGLLHLGGTTVRSTTAALVIEVCDAFGAWKGKGGAEEHFSNIGYPFCAKPHADASYEVKMKQGHGIAFFRDVATRRCEEQVNEGQERFQTSVLWNFKDARLIPEPTRRMVFTWVEKYEVRKEGRERGEARGGTSEDEQLLFSHTRTHTHTLLSLFLSSSSSSRSRDSRC